MGLVVVILVSQYQSALQSQRTSVSGSRSNGGIGAPGTSVASTFVDSGAISIVNSIIKLESTSDAKCHSTACRLEDFMYGTPLSDDARNMRWEFQRKLVGSIWSRASQDAARQGQQEVTGEQLQPHIDEVVTVTRSHHGNQTDDGSPLDSGQITVLLGGQKPITIPQVRFRQFSSIAYSLRVILSVQQDVLIGVGPELLQLSNDGLESLKQTLDTITICALLIADEEARRANEAQISGATMQGAWRSLLAEASIEQVGKTPPRPIAKDAAHQQSMGVLKAAIDGKLAAYRAYNSVSEDDAEDLMWMNTRRFYARYPVPNEQPALSHYRQALVPVMNGFALELLAVADRHAQEAGHRFIRAADAQRAVEEMMAPKVDDIEDVHFFTRLAGEGGNIMLESYDCDSYRDFGMHWMVLGAAFDELPPSSVLPDSFAVEIIVEAISQYGVLLLRVAGEHAREKLTAEYLQPVDVYHARDKISELARRHREAPPLATASGGIVSSTSGNSMEREHRYFTDTTAASGAAYTHRSSRWLNEFRHKEEASYPTFNGGGVAAGDIDDDGHMDLLLVGGDKNSLFMGHGNGKFQEITETAGISFQRSDGTHVEALQPILADFDNDGQTDILITCAGDNHLIYRNLNGRRFQDVSDLAGLGGEGLVGGPATVFDFDGDGLLDIYIGYFGNYLKGAIPNWGHDNYNALPNKLFRNEGDFRFHDVSAGSGVDDEGWTQAVSHTDFDRDGRQDIVVANDFGQNNFFRNLGDGKFENVSKKLGLNKYYHSMNVGICDLNDDDYPDVYISNIATLVKDNKYVMPNEETLLQLNSKAMAAMLVKEANMFYMSQANEDGLQHYQPSDDVDRGPTSTGWAWDAEFLDFDNDGDDDLYCVNGNNDYNFWDKLEAKQKTAGALPGRSDAEKVSYYSHSRESNVFFVNEDGKLKNHSLRSGADFIGNSRSTAYLDMDGDGDLDIVVNNFHSPATVLRNNSEETGHNWIKIRLVGDPDKRTNRDAIGARLIATTAESGNRVVREIQGGSGFLSMNPTQQHFGLGKATTVDMKIIWPNGDRQEVTNLRCNQVHTIQQSQAVLAGISSVDK